MAQNVAVQNAILDLIPARRGHFLLESGHHGDLWLDIELLFLHPNRLAEAIGALASLLRPFAVDMACGPLNEGAFVALLVAERLGIEFCYAEPTRLPEASGLFPIAYRLPTAQRQRVGQRRIALVNDVTNAGSAVRGTYADLLACQAHPVVIGSLVVLGDALVEFAAHVETPLVRLGTVTNTIWTPEECPLCAANVPLEKVL